MKVFGSISRLVSLLFRKDSQDITLRPNQSTTYTASRDIQLPAGDTAHVLVSASSTATLTNKTIDGDDNTLSDISISSLKTVLGDADEVIVRDAAGAVVSAKLVNANVDASAAIDATKIHDGSVSNTEFGYISTLSSNAQDQLDAKASTALDNLTVASLAAESLLVGASSSAVDALAVGTNGQVLTVVAGAVAWAAPSADASFKDDWVTADTATKAIVHNLNTLDVMVQVYDVATGETIEIDSAVRTDVDTLTVTASEAPPAGGWRVLILPV